MQLSDYFAVLWRRKWVIIVTVVATMAVVVAGTSRLPRIYSATTTLRVATAYSGSTNYSDYMYADRLLNTYVKIATSQPLLDELSKQLGVAKLPKINVSTLPNTELIQISVEDQSPALASKAANALGDILIAQSAGFYTGSGKSPIEILSAQMAEVEKDLKQARADYESLLVKKQNDAAATEAASKSLALKQQVYDSRLQQQEQISNKEARQASYISVAQAAKDLKQATTDYEALLAKEQKSTAEFETASKTFNSKQQIYDSLSQQYEQARIRAALQANTISVVESAGVPSLPSKPNILLNYALGFITSLIAGLGLAFLFENLDNTLHTSGQIELASALPSLGRISSAGSKKEMRFPLDGRSHYAESFLRLRTNLAALDHGSVPMRTLLVTSAEQGEGKSTVASTLAYVQAEAGKKVILVDCDMRLPNLHKQFNLPNEVGLCEYLSRTAPMRRIIQPTSLRRLSVITSGQTPVIPADLLGSPRMTTFIQLLLKHFDVVVMDSPSILAVADVSILAPQVDGVLLVARQGKVHREALKTACKQLEDVKARVIGLAVNGEPVYRHYYYYGKSGWRGKGQGKDHKGQLVTPSPGRREGKTLAQKLNRFKERFYKWRHRG